MAGLVQYLSAKLGLVTGRTLPEAVADHTRTPTRIALLAAGRIGRHRHRSRRGRRRGDRAVRLLFDLPLLVGGVITGVVSLLLLVVQDRRGQRVFERVITGLLLVIAIGFLTSLFVNAPPRRSGRRGSAAPVRRRRERAAGHRDARRDGDAARGVPAFRAGPRPARPPAGRRGPQTAAARHPLGRRHRHAGRRRGEPGHAAGRGDQPAGPRRHRLHRRRARRRAATRSGPTVALFFAIGLLASGLASTSVGAYAGAMIMQGLLRKSYPLLVRRLVTLIPALVDAGHRRRSQPRAGALAGGAVVRHPVRARSRWCG